MAGIVTEGRRAMDEAEDEGIRDAVVAGLGQRVEHYEVAAYAVAEGHALILGEDDVAELLEQTRREEAEAAETFAGIAENRVNDAAVGG
jgi:ferritin-like metal-binding protein YciE